MFTYLFKNLVILLLFNTTSLKNHFIITYAVKCKWVVILNNIVECDEEQEGLQFNDLEKSILREIIINPRNTVSNISKNINKTRTTTSKHLKNLIDQNKIKFFTNININSLNIEFFVIRISMKRFIDVEYFTNLFNSCPKTVFSLYIQSNNDLLVALFDEKSERINNKFFSCIHLIHRIQSDERVLKCEIEPLCDLIMPGFINIDSRMLIKSNKTTPCDECCGDCINYTRTCKGCPCTIYYKGNFCL